MSIPNTDVGLGRVWRYQRGNQNPYIEEGHITQWPTTKKDKRTKNDVQSKTLHRKLKIEW